MPTNAQMEAQDEFDARRTKVKLVREGLLEQLDGRSKNHAPRHIRALAWGESQTRGKEKAPDFHIPAARRIRHRTPDGITSFHFAHSSVSKVTHSTVIEGVRHMPGAGVAHTRYIERESAVAHLAKQQDDGLELHPEPGSGEEATDDSPEVKASALASEVRGQASSPFTDDEMRPSRERDEPNTRRNSTSPKDAGHDHADQDGSSLASRFDDYLTRPSALASGPGLSRALISNISDGPDDRTEFWKLVEKHERKPSPDQMVFRHCDFPEFWDTVMQHPDCPTQIKKKLAGPDRDTDKPIKIGHGKKVRAFLRRQPGWVEPVKEEQAEPEQRMARFIDGRGGRTQYRINGELPRELNPAQNFALLSDFTMEFERRKLPFLAVMHAPDHQNDDRNWHFHLAYVDRPARRITQADIDRLAKDFDVSAVSPGDWDFAVEVTKLGRQDGRLSRPLRQNKVAEVSRSRDWPKKLRNALAEVTNRHLVAAGVSRRVSAESFEDLGISADPQTHLGTALNAIETQGTATPRGIENEEVQWKAIQAQADARYRAELEAAEARIASATSGQWATIADTSSRENQLREELERAALLRRNAFLLEQELERAASRARLVRERNLKLLKAEEADPKTANAKRIARYQSLIGKATRYLAALSESTVDEMMLAVRWRSTARKCEQRAKAIEAELSKAPSKTAEKMRPAPDQHPFQGRGIPVQRSRGRESHVPAARSQEEIDYWAEFRRKLDIVREELRAEKEADTKTPTVQPKPSSPAEETKAEFKRSQNQMPPPGFDFDR